MLASTTKNSENLNPLIDSPKIRQKRFPTSNANKAVMKKLTRVMLLSMTFMIIEIIGGIISNSIAILADAGHLFSDIIGFAVSIASVWISGIRPNKRRTFGYDRAGVLGAMASVFIIWIITGVLVYFAVQRITNLDEVELDGRFMFGTSCFGLLTNLTMMKVLTYDPEERKRKKMEKLEKKRLKNEISTSVSSYQLNPYTYPSINLSEDLEPSRKYSVLDKDPVVAIEKTPSTRDGYPEEDAFFKVATVQNGENNETGRQDDTKNLEIEMPQTDKKKVDDKSTKDNMNIRATTIHILGDMIQSIGVIIAAALIWYDSEKNKIADPIITFIFSAIVLCTTLRIMKDCISTLMESVPHDFKIDELDDALHNIEGVVDVHDLHVWSVGDEKTLMSAHMGVKTSDTKEILKKAVDICKEFGVDYPTIQIESVLNEGDPNYINCSHELEIVKINNKF